LIERQSRVKSMRPAGVMAQPGDDAGDDLSTVAGNFRAHRVVFRSYGAVIEA